MDPQQSLRAFFTEGFQRMYLADARPRTIDEYRFSVAAWESIHGALPLASIDVPALAKFREELQRRAGRSSKRVSRATVNKHLRHIGAIINKAGPPGPHNRDALGLLAQAPWIKQLRIQMTLPRPVSLDQLAALHDAADAARSPTTEHAPTWWRSLIVAAYNLAYRRGAWLALCDDDVDWKAATVRVPAHADKCSCERLKPANSAALAALLRVRKPGTLFAWTHGAKRWYQTWAAINIAAGTDLHFHDLKRAAATQLAKIASPWQVRYMLDHAQHDVAGRHYIDALDDLRAVVERLPQPWRDDKERKHAQ